MSEKIIKPVFPIGSQIPENFIDIERREFLETDSAENYKTTKPIAQKMFDKFGVNWRYLYEKINYNININGLRADENFDENYDFSNTYVVLGDSFVKGIGVGEQDTIPAYVEKQSGIKTLNFGNGGTGCDVVFFNAMWLSGLKNPPKKIFVVWPQTHRFSRFYVNYDSDNKTFERSGPHNRIVDAYIPHTCLKKKEFAKFFKMDIMVEPSIQSGNKLMYQQILRNTWGSKMVEMDVLDPSEYNKTFQGIHIMNEIRHDHFYSATPEEILNDWIARDIHFKAFRELATGQRRDGPCHYGPKVYEGMAKWLLSQ